MQNATTKFYSAKYSKSKGVLAFYNDLERYAGRMVARPDDYTFKRQLLRGLPQDMVEVLIKTRRVTAEHTSLPRLLQEAKAMESAFQAVEQHKKDRHTTAHDRSGHVVVATVAQNSGKTVRFNTSRKPSKYRSSSTPHMVSTNHHSRPQQGRSSTPWKRSNSPAHRSGSSRPPSRSSTGPSLRPGPSASSSQTRTAKPAGSSSSNKVTCFTCGQEGHYSNSCPNNKPKVYAAQVTDTEDDQRHDQDTDHDRGRESHDEQETQEEGELVGSQYTSGEEEYPLEQYEEYDGFEPEYTADNESNDPQAYGLRVLEDYEERPSVSLRTMTTSEETPQNVMRSSLKRIEGRMERPMRPRTETQCLAGYTIINGVKAFTLFDTGSNTDAISNAFARVSRVPVYELEKPATLALGCIGSKSKINYGTVAKTVCDNENSEEYFDIANLAQYDAILGIPYMYKHDIMLDVK